jgi:hypothetical protein
MAREHRLVRFKRYCGEVIVHARSEQHARELRAAIAARPAGCGLQLNEHKTRIVYCKDWARRGSDEHERFDFLEYTLRPRWRGASPANSSSTSSPRRGPRRGHQRRRAGADDRRGLRGERADGDDRWHHLTGGVTIATSRRPAAAAAESIFPVRHGRPPVPPSRSATVHPRQHCRPKRRSTPVIRAARSQTPAAVGSPTMGMLTLDHTLVSDNRAIPPRG